MADTNEAIEKVKSLAHVFQSVIDLAAALGEATNIDQVVGESRVALTRVQAEVKAAQDALAMIRTTSAETVAKAREEADSILAAMTHEVEGMRAKEQQALASATAKETEANAYAQRVREAADAQVASITSGVAAKQQELADLTARIERARIKMSEMLGA